MAKLTHQDIPKLRAEIEACRDEMNWLNVAQVPQDELKERATNSCRELAARFDAPRSLGMFANPGAGFFELISMFRTNARVVIHGMPNESSVTSANSDDVGPMIACVMGDSLVQRMHAEIDHLDYRPGPPTIERPARLAELKATLRTLEQQEEALICQAEEAGVCIARRGDADPAVILAFDPNGKTTDAGMARTTGQRRAWDATDSDTPVATDASMPTSSDEAVS